jgi:putative spermidine/putrescine transport system substrate-binding protein/putrescine transport system substrate-binding protein
VVNLYIWGEYLAPDTLKNFEAQTGIQVVADHFDSLETVETKLLTGRSGYDLVLTAGQHLSRAIESGAIQPLDKAQVPHFAGVGEEFRQHMAVFDPGNATPGFTPGAPRGGLSGTGDQAAPAEGADRQLGDAV